MTFSIKRGDRLPILAQQLVDPDGTPANLTGATVVFNMSRAGVAKITRASVTVVDALTGEVEYNWLSQDTDTVGTFRGEFEVSYGGLPLTYPNKGYLIIEVEQDLG